jgi:thioredoxin reductase (NADPH)
VAEDPTAFPTLSDSQIALLDGFGNRRRVERGEILYREGDATYDFFVVLSGEVEIFTGTGADQRPITRHGAGRFLGELNLLTGLRVFVTARVAEAGEVLVLPASQLRRIIATQPTLSDMILAAFIARRSVLMTGAGSAIRVIGSRFNPATARIREFLLRTRIPHEWLDPDRDPDVERLLREFSLDTDELPVVIATGSVLRNPSVGELAEFLGITVANLPGRCFDLVVVGGGPAGLAAAVYGASEGLSTLGVEALAVGGQAGTSSRIENYLGFPTGISGGDLTQRAVVQAEKFGAALTSPCAAAGLREEAGHLLVRLVDGTEVVGRAVIVASGARYRRLAAMRLEEFEGKGVYYAATEAEVRQCAPAPVVVVGGGNSAGQAAVFLAESGSRVTVVIRRSDLNASMSRYLVDRIIDHPHIDVKANTNVTALDGDDALERVVLSNADGNTEIDCSGLFSFIGADPESEWLSGCAALDDRGFVLTDRALTDDHLDDRWNSLGRPPLPFETSHPGLFAVGDVRSGSTKRVAAAVGEGSAAVRSVHDYLSFTR